MKDKNLQAPWVGKTSEEYEHPECSDYEIEFTLLGRITIFAKSRSDALDKYSELSYSELAPYIHGDFSRIDEVK